MTVPPEPSPKLATDGTDVFPATVQPKKLSSKPPLMSAAPAEAGNRKRGTVNTIKNNNEFRRLSELAGIIGELEESRLVNLDFLSGYYINARYKEDLEELSKGIIESVAQDFIQFAEETMKWLCQKIK